MSVETERAHEGAKKPTGSRCKSNPRFLPSLRDVITLGLNQQL